jgi:hypothetical protein
MFWHEVIRGRRSCQVTQRVDINGILATWKFLGRQLEFLAEPALAMRSAMTSAHGSFNNAPR